jgi:hypothetical protein
MSASKSALIFDSVPGNLGADVVLDLEPRSLEVRHDQVEERDDWGNMVGIRVGMVQRDDVVCEGAVVDEEAHVGFSQLGRRNMRTWGGRQGVGGLDVGC